MAVDTRKLYKLTRGEHRHPNPEYDPAMVNTQEVSHFVIGVGDKVMLTDAQFKAFKDKFEPCEADASGVRDGYAAELDQAKKQAATTGQTVNPNPVARPSMDL
jgi:hypothetical protein